MSSAIAMATAGTPKAVIAPRACASIIILMTGISIATGRGIVTVTGATTMRAAAITAAASGSPSDPLSLSLEKGGPKGPPFSLLAQHIFRRAARGVGQLLQGLRRDCARLAGEEGEDFARWHTGGAGPFAGAQMAGEHEGAEGITLLADLHSARHGDFAHQHFGFCIRRGGNPFGLFGFGARLGCDVRDRA